MVVDDNAHENNHVKINKTKQARHNHLSTLNDILEISKENLEGIYQVKETYLQIKHIIGCCE